MSRPRFGGSMQAALAGSFLLFSAPLDAAPELRASIDWRGECDDRPSLHREIEARGGHLTEVDPELGTSSLTVDVERTAAGILLAELGLHTPSGSQRRHVEARECSGLRSALAWVLSVLAEEQHATELSSAPSKTAFPASPFAGGSAGRTQGPAGHAAPPPAVRTEPATQSADASARPCVRARPRFGVGAELLLGLGMIDAVTLGPALLGSYRPCARYAPSVVLGVSRLQSVSYELDGRSISFVRTSAQAGALFDLVGPLRAGVSLELGRVQASGSPSREGAGGSGSAPWVALLAPIRLSVPLFSPDLSWEVGAAAAYTPQSFVLRYASGGELARPRHFELRGSFGLAGHF